jgi:hypothetical protein
MRVTVQQAAANALRTYLQSQMDLREGSGAVVVLDRWPPSGELAQPRSISVITAGEREDVYKAGLQAELVRQSSVNSTTGLYTWRVAACSQLVQLDVWATYDVALDEMLADLDQAFRQGTSVTLGLTNGMPFREGVLLAMGDDWQGFVDCTLEGGPNVHHSNEAHVTNEHRATLRCRLDMDLTLQAQSPKLLRVLLEQTLGGSPVTHTLEPVDGQLEVTGSS